MINRHPVVAVSKRTGQVLAVGADARRMLDRTPAEIVLMPTLRRARRSRSTRLFLALSASMVLLTVLSDQPWASGARDAPRSELAQVTSAMTGWSTQVDRFKSMFGNSAELRAENARLRAADERLRAQLLQLGAVSKDNAALRLALDFERTSGYHMVAAQVVARGPDGGFSLTMEIDRGTDAGVRRGMVVVTGAGLLGRIEEAGSRYAIVQTLRDPWSRADVTLVNSNLQGTVFGGTTSLRIAIQNPDRIAVAKGDWALTNGADGAYPGGLVVGELIAPDRLAWVADPPSVTFVLVITDFQPS